MRKYILGFAIGLSALILVLSAVIAITLSSGSLDLLAKNRLLDYFNTEFRGRLRIERVDLQFPSRIVLHRPALYRETAENPDVEAKTLTLDLNFLRLLSDFSAVTIRSMKADSLRLHVERYGDGTTTLGEIFAPADEANAGAPGLESILCGRLQLRDASIDYLWHPDSSATPETLAVKGIALRGRNLRYAPRNISGTVSSLGFNIPEHGFSLHEASATFSFTGNRSEITNLRAKTGKSSVELSTGLYEFDIFAPDSAASPNSSLFLDLSPSRIHTDELALLFPGTPLPEGLYNLSCSASGRLRKVTVKSAAVSRGEDVLSLEGELLNLDQPDFLSFRIQTNDSMLSGGFLQEALPDSTARAAALALGDLEFSGSAQGTLDEIQTELDLRTEAGTARISLRTELPFDSRTHYSGGFELEEFRLHRFLSDDTTASSGINCSGAFTGRGIPPAPAEAGLSVEIGPSYWQRQEIASGNLTITYGETVLETGLELRGGGASLSLEGTVDWQDGIPVYSAKSSGRNIDISRVLDTEELRSDLTFSLQSDGRHFDPERLEGNLLVRFMTSTIDDYTLKNDSEISLRVERKSSMSSIALRSDFLDFTATGIYTFGDFLSGTKLSADAFSRELARNNVWNDAPLPPAPEEHVGNDFSADYRLTVRDISPLALFIPVKDYSLQGRASGRSYRSNGLLHFTSAAEVTSLKRDTVLSLQNASFRVEAAYDRNGVSGASIDARAASIRSGGHALDEAVLKTVYEDATLKTSAYFVAPEIEREVSLDVTARRSGNPIEITIGKFVIQDPAGTWRIKSGSRIDIGKDYTRLYGLQMTKTGQSISCNGLLSNERTGSFECGISNLDLAELGIFFPGAGLRGRLTSSLAVSGAPGAKTATLNMNGNDIVYDDVVIGDLRLKASHRGERLRADFSTGRTGPEALNDIRGTASIPVRINWSPPGYAIPDNRQVSVSCTAEHLSAEILEVLLPFFETAEGTIPAKLTVRGTTPDPEIYFSTTLNNTAITVTPTETAYRLSGLVEITPEKAVFNNITIRDDLGGTGTINGRAGLEKLEAKTIDLTASFDNLLLFNKQDKKDESSFGTITGRTKKIRFFGDIAEPVLTGRLTITNADFTLYRTGSNESAKYVGVEKFIEFVPRNPAPADTPETEGTVPPENPEFYYTLIDIVQIQDLRLESSAPLKYNMIFDRVRGEQLETTLRNLSLNVNKRQQSYRLFGSVNVTSGKYRFSNTNFDLDDGGRIVWNNVDIRNGVMRNLFGRKYVNATNAQTGESDNVRLLLAIQGTLNNPNVQMGYYLNDDSQPFSSENMIGMQSSKIDPNAELNVISLLLTKQWYIRPGSQASYGKLPFSSVGISAGTGLISSQISQFVEKAAGLESFNVNFGVDEQGGLSGLELSLAFLVPGTGGKMRFIGTGSSPDIGETALFDYYGNSQQLQYRITPKVFFEAYRSYGLFGNDVTTTNLLEPTETYGVSIAYRERFYTWEQFWNRIFGSSP